MDKKRYIKTWYCPICGYIFAWDNPIPCPICGEEEVRFYKKETVHYENLMKLGIIRDNTTKKVVNHRSLLKIIFNPLLRCIGLQIATEYDSSSDRLGGIVICRCKVQFSFWKKYYRDDSYIEKRRIFV